MDAMVTAALVGTAQQGNTESTTGTSVDALTEQLAEGEAERKLLLSAGAWAIYRQAGYVAQPMPINIEPAAPETLPACSQKIAALLQGMFEGTQRELLPEALERMWHAGLRLPHELLPIALDVQGDELHNQLFPVLGERGRWLSRFNPAWSWVAQHLPGTREQAPPDAETLWQEGTPGQRLTLLRLLRETDPAKAREWLAAAWKQEKAEARTELLGTFEVGLSAEDEAFLEKALDDRSTGVRSAAALLLARIPTSAFAGRMRARAEAMLTCIASTLTVKPPAELDKEWQRDGIVAKPPAGTGARAYWFAQVLELVPPPHWEERFGLAAEALIVAAAANHAWHETLMTRWAKATLLHDSSRWILPLWHWCYQQSDSLHISLLRHMPAAVAEQKMLQLLPDAKHAEKDIWEQALAVLPRPWSKAFGDAYIAGCQSYLSTLTFDTHSDYSWYRSLALAAAALPAACFANAIENLVIAENREADSAHTYWQRSQWQQAIQHLQETLRLRTRLMEEIM